MDLTEAYAPSQNRRGGTVTEEKTTDYFDFVVSPPPHCTNADGTVDGDNFLQHTDCRTINFLEDADLNRDSFIANVKEANNNTIQLPALPPVSTITGHINRNCGYPLLEDLSYYTNNNWNTSPATSNDHHSGLLNNQRRDSPLGDMALQQHRDCSSDDRQNTDGAIYTLTVLNSEANSIDGLECCKSSPSGTTSDGWTLRNNQLDLDAILNMESSVNISDPNDRDNERGQDVVSVNGNVVDRYTAIAGTQYTTDDQTGPFGVTIKTEPFGVTVKAEHGDNNNDWKLSDRNNLQETVTVSESAAESLLRNALQGKLYSTTTSLTGATRLLGDGSTSGQPNQDDTMQTCTDELLLSQLDVDGTYRTGDYDKLKNIANEVVESYCNLEPVCNVQATTVMYTLDPASGSLGTITLPADLAQVGTVTVVTTAPPQQDVLHQDTRHTEQQQPTVTARTTTATSQLQLPNNTTTTGRSTKAPKKYVRRANRNTANAAGNGGAGATSQGGAGATGSPGAVQQRKERSLHYCSICSKGFKDKYSVNVHIRTHTGEKPFACSLCGKSFRQKAHLAKHYQTHVQVDGIHVEGMQVEGVPVEQQQLEHQQQIIEMPADSQACTPSS
ncbi:hypothetical protein TSAR_002163 [Trichomalopsis sarcophagae]|uniref:C2H2-type domain-containing protein n=1 Tax=Trichomalopsis sarcophagae TaxID=543379 RepID=A0A232EM88_9HYME|nr:hypothetical protein TSAR_002163 [Trichomalopsis sarcophagae]